MINKNKLESLLVAARTLQRGRHGRSAKRWAESRVTHHGAGQGLAVPRGPRAERAARTYKTAARDITSVQTRRERDALSQIARDPSALGKAGPYRGVREPREPPAEQSGQGYNLSADTAGGGVNPM